MTGEGKRSADELLIEALRAGRPDPSELGPSRLELERRRLMARLADGGAARAFAGGGRPWVRALALAAAAAVIAAIAIALFAARGDRPIVALSGEWKVEPGDAIAQGATIQVPPGARAALALADGTRIWADGGARLRLADADGAAVRLFAGRIAARAAKRGNGAPPFSVSTEFGTVSVMGTVFTISIESQGMIVRLYEGKVRLAAAGGSVTLAPGRSARANGDGIAALGIVSTAERRADLAFAGEAIGRAPSAEAAAVAVAPRSAGEAAAASAPPVDASRLVAKAAAAAPPTSGGPAELDPVARALALWRAGRYAEIVALTADPGTAPELLLYRGKALGALGRWAEAGRAFAGAADGGGDRRAEASYLAAAAFHKAGDYPGSLALSERAAALGGPNADHAQRLVFASLVGLGRYADAGRSANGYLTAFPQGAHVAEARFVVGTGARLSRDWAAAAAGYAEFLALGRGEPQMRDDAAFYVGYCRLMAGSAAEGKRNLELYLASYPTGRHAEQARAALSN